MKNIEPNLWYKSLKIGEDEKHIEGLFDLNTNQFYGNPMVPESRILKQCVVIFVARKKSTHLLENVLVTIIIKICEGDTMALL